MAIMYRAQLDPTKSEILKDLLDERSWGGQGDLDVLGSYRFDDPAGEVGIECHLVRREERGFHLPLTYRAAPLADAGEYLLGTTTHSVLGERYVYDGIGDEVALDCFRRSLCGEQNQAELEIWEDDRYVGVREQSVDLRLEADEGAQLPTAQMLLDGDPFTIARTLDGLDGTVRLVASWADGESVVAAY